MSRLTAGRKNVRQILLILGAALMTFAAPAAAGPVSWNQTENMKQAGRELAEMWAREGAFGIFRHIESCHKEHVVEAKDYTAKAEACLVQDVIHSQVSARMYSGLSKAAREMSGSPRPETVLDAMKGRLSVTARKFGFSGEEIEALARLGFETGAPVYLETLKQKMAAARQGRERR